MSQLSFPPTVITLVRPAVLRWLDDLGLAVRAWRRRWREQRKLSLRERALRQLDRRVLQDLGLPEPEPGSGWNWRDIEPTRW